MRTLHHHPLDPFSRKVRLCLAEKRLEFQAVIEKPWERRAAFMVLNPAGDVPVLQYDDGPVMAHSQAICEYLDEMYPEPPLMGKDPIQRAEVRRLTGWFDGKFFREVTRNLAGEKLWNRISGGHPPDSRILRAGRANIVTHLAYIAWLTERRRWLAGDSLTLADLAAAAQISVLDFGGDVPWHEHPLAKDWYVRIKSRPSFRALLDDQVPGITPPPQYADLDF